MTIIANSRKFIFVHLHKCGGTSVKYAYEWHAAWNDFILGSTTLGETVESVYRPRYGLYKHNSASELKRIVGPEVWSEYWTFALVRHPLRIYESYYGWIRKILQRYMRENNLSQDEFVTRYRQKEIDEPFVNWLPTRAFVESTCFAEFVDVILKRQWLNQTSMSKLSEAGHLIVDQVYKLEQLDRLWDEFEARNALKLAHRPHANRGDDEKYEWDKTHLEEMYRRFETDFRTFDYA